MKRDQQIEKGEIWENVVTWKPKEKSISRRKWSLAGSGAEMPEVFSGFGDRKFTGDLHKGTQP